MADLRTEPYKKVALEMAQFLRHHPTLKNKSGNLDGKRVEYFKGMRLPPQVHRERCLTVTGKACLKALQSEAYAKVALKNPIMPKIKTIQDAGEAMRLLPIHLLALRVDLLEKEKAKKGSAAKPSRKLQINRQQEINPDHHYVWFYEYIPLTTKLAGLGLLALVLSGVMYPLWPPTMRIGVYYLSWLALGLVGLLMVIAVIRLLLYVITMFAVPPGIWLYPNLFEDVGFFDSFRPLWGWHENADDKKAAKLAKKEARLVKEQEKKSGSTATGVKSASTSTTATTTGSETKPRAAYIEEIDEDDD